MRIHFWGEERLVTVMWLFMLTFFTSCVGTIEQEVPEFTQSTNVPTNPNFTFNGLNNGTVKAIAHDKVLLKFWPAQGGSGAFSYRVYTNSNLSSISASFSTSQLTQNYMGQYEIVVKNLNRATNYSFILRAYDLNSSVEDSNTVEMTIDTFSYYVPDFNGVELVENLSGMQASTGVNVKWYEAATPVSDPFNVSVHRPSGYKVYYATSPITLLAGTGSFKVVSSRAQVSDVITGLSANSSYFYMVRSVAVSGTEEKNEKILDVKTLVESTEINFDGLASSSFDATSCSSASIDLSWLPGTGAFNRYKIVRRTQSFDQSTFDHSADLSGDTSWNIQTLSDLSLTNYKAVGLSFNQDYYFAVYACNSTTNLCKSSHTDPTAQRVNPIRSRADVSNITFEDAGLTDVVLKFQIPAEGCFDRLIVYEHATSTNSNKTEITSSSAGIQLNVSDPRNARDKKVVKNLEVGKTYHFSVQTELDSTLSSAGAVYSFDGTTKPIFNFSSFTCAVDGSTNQFKCNWVIGSPTNDSYTSFKDIYKSFAIAYAVYPTEGQQYSIDTAEFNCNTNCSSSNAQHTVITPINVASLEHVFTTPLSPGKTHAFRIIADTDIAGLDDFTTQASALTPAITATHKGWFNIISLGPKIKRNVPIPEKMVVDANTKILYPEATTSGVQNVTSSSRGLVSVEWNDFTLSSGQSFYDYYEGLGSAIKATSGYKVYRYESQAENETVNPDVSTSGWTQVSGASPVPPLKETGESLQGPAQKRFARFVDYSASTGDAIPTGGEDVTYRPINNTTSGKAYYYKVLLFINGQGVDIAASAEYTATSVIKVIVPPNNMALVHPWISNRAACEILHKTTDPLNNYRCDYKGFGHSEVAGSKYLDQGGFLFVDRFEIGTNYSRGNSGDSTQGCHVKSGETIGTLGKLIKDHFYGHPDFPRVSNIRDQAATPKMTDANVGDCIGSENPTALKLEAPEGSVYTISPYTGHTYVQQDPGVGSNWKYIAYAFGDESSYKLAYTNQAGLPTMKLIDQDKIPEVCTGNKLNVKYGSETSSNITKLLLSRKEQIAAADYQPQLSNTNMNSILKGATPGYCNTNHHYSKQANYYSALDGNYVDAFGSGVQDASLSVDYSRYVRTNPFSSSVRNTGASSGGSSLNTGSDLIDSDGLQGKFMYDSRKCVSRFGVQDLYGNQADTLRDKIYCYFEGGTDDFYCSMGYKDAVARSNPFTGFDGNAQTDWLNGEDDNYLSFAQTNSFDHSSSTTILGPLDKHDTQTAWMGNDFSGYFNTVMGMPLSSKATGDNAISSVQNNPGAANLGFKYQGTDHSSYPGRFSRLQFTNTKSVALMSYYSNQFNFTSREVQMMAGGYANDVGVSGRWGMYFAYQYRGWYVGGRCSGLLPY